MMTLYLFYFLFFPKTSAKKLTKNFFMCIRNNQNSTLDLFFNGISGSQKDCDLPKTTVLHGSNNFGQLQSPTTNVSDTTNNTRLHVSSGLCDSHNMHQDQVIN